MPAKMLHRRVLLEEAITQSGFSSKLEAYRLGSLDSSNRVWFQLRTLPDVKLPEQAERSLSPAVMRDPGVKVKLYALSDILVELKSVELLETVTKAGGYYAVVGLRACNQQTVNGLVEATTHHVKENVEGGGYLTMDSPFQEATDEDLAKGIVVRMLCKVSVFAGQITSTFIHSKTNKTVLGPGAKAADMCELPPLGLCHAAVHLMGFWHDDSQYGLMLYLNNVQLATPPAPPRSTLLTTKAESPAKQATRPTSHLSPMTEPRRKVTRSRSLWGEDETSCPDTPIMPIFSPASSTVSSNGEDEDEHMDIMRITLTESVYSRATTCSYLSEDEELEDLEPAKPVETTWVTCGGGAPGDEDGVKAEKDKAQSIFSLPGDRASQSHPNPRVRSLFA